MPKIIIVHGSEDTGKTSSILTCMKNFGTYIKIGLNDRPKDKLVVFESNILEKIYKLGFASGGDNFSTIDNNIDFFKHHSPDCMVFASRGPVGNNLYNLIDGYAKLLGVLPIKIQTRRNASGNHGAYIQGIANQIAANIP